eukprot:TRINITY_DN13093_c0_g1_i3.p1 TRINITY_DN13093_c0_g1~~TRINITY_DN13093_c0_g1_i3.p1  ORF type:complete len:188 (+),score=31.03 TRINITY_DN13093_c0_g1_i3:102-665(+)
MSLKTSLFLLFLLLVVSPGYTLGERDPNELRDLIHGLASGIGVPFEDQEFRGSLGVDTNRLLDNLQRLQSYSKETQSETIEKLEDIRDALASLHSKYRRQKSDDKSIISILNATLIPLASPKKFLASVRRNKLESELVAVGKAIPRFITFAGSQFGMIVRHYSQGPRANISEFISGFLSSFGLQVPS